MTYPSADSVVIPDIVRCLAGGADLRCVWRNELGGLTFEAVGFGKHRFIKWGPRNEEFSLSDEAERMTWASQWITVPEVIDHGGDETHEWLITTALDGLSAVHPRWVKEPAVAVRAVGEGLRAMHDSLPVEQCPWDWSVSTNGIEFPEVDRLVVCHGDPCCPNTLLDAHGSWLGHVDLSQLGRADRWADLAVASMNTAWNYGPGWEDALIEAYGVEPDRERLAFYRDLWNAT